mgnify:FL=1
MLNALIGEKVSIVTPKKQTTRENILGILNEEDFQIVFVDTPGIHKTKDDLGKAMMRSVRSAMSEADLVLYMVDATRPFDKEEFETIEKKAQEMNVILVLSKIDLAGFDKTYPLIDKFNAIKELKMILPISSRKNQNLDVLVEEIKKYLIPMKEDELYYDRETYTDKTVRFLAEEIIREKALLLLNEEVPHGIFIQITNFKEGKGIVKIDADISVKKNSHKAIVIGKGGEMLKNIATKSRIDIEKMLGQKVLLNVYVKSRDL